MRTDQMSLDEPMLNTFPAPVADIIIKNSAIHGRGCFAGNAITAGMRVIEYVGEKIDKAESLRRCEAGNEYIFALDETHDLDGSVERNIARFINHSCSPNCETVPEGGRIWIIALSDIAAGEELTFNYGYDLIDYREHPCKCSSVWCAGYIVAEEFIEDIRRRSGGHGCLEAAAIE
jgi:SET domain-containing protein